MRRPRHIPFDVADWRRSVLEQAGFEPLLADELAAQPDLDLHEALNLVDRGCPPHLAARILAPLDDRPTTPQEP
jgi:hypothetical protein